MFSPHKSESEANVSGKRKRIYLCKGCDMSPKGWRQAPIIYCHAVNEEVDAVPHTKGRSFRTCELRRKMISVPSTSKTTQAMLRELAAESRKLPASLDIPTRNAKMSQIEARLRKKHGLSD